MSGFESGTPKRFVPFMIGKLGVSSKSERGKKEEILGFLFQKKKKLCFWFRLCVKRENAFFFFFLFNF